MKRHILVVFAAIGVLFALWLTYVLIISNYNKHQIDPENFTGKMLFHYPHSYSEKPIYGSLLFVCDPQTGELVQIDIDGQKCCFMGNTSTVLAVRFNGTFETYSIVTKERRTVFKKESTGSDVTALAYIDDKHFSWSDYKNVYLVDILTGESEIIAEDASGTHSWTEDGKTVFYGTNWNFEGKQGVYRYNTETGTRDFVVEGDSPHISRDGTMLLYTDTKGFAIVRNLESRKEWRYNNATYYHCFSPDGKYVAIVEPWHGSWLKLLNGTCYYDSYVLNIWDYRLNKVTTLFPRYANGQCRGIDWAE